jgi:hypothetical protein
MGRDLPVSAETQMGVASGMGVAVGGGQSSVAFTMLVSPSTDADIEEMAKELGTTKTDVFRRALALLRLGLEARKDGMHLALVDADGKTQTEITGL